MGLAPLGNRIVYNRFTAPPPGMSVCFRLNPFRAQDIGLPSTKSCSCLNSAHPSRQEADMVTDLLPTLVLSY